MKSILPFKNNFLLMKLTHIGYHGTELQYVDEILKKGFTHRIRDDHWLGQGIYFYTDLELAKWWANTKFKKLDRQPAVIKVVIEVDDTAFLDLDTVAGMDFFFNKSKELLSDMSFGVRVEDNLYKNLCFALDYLKEMEDIQVVRYTFSKDSPSYGIQRIADFEKQYFKLPRDFAYHETQICVSENDLIVHKICCYPNRIRTWR
jgi:hypothetical protein